MVTPYAAEIRIQQGYISLFETGDLRFTNDIGELNLILRLFYERIPSFSCNEIRKRITVKQNYKIFQA